MSKQADKLFEERDSGKQPGLAEGLRQAASTANHIGGQIWDGMKPMFDHGRTELAAALFAGHAHVMYMKGEESPLFPLEQDQGKQPETGIQAGPRADLDPPGREAQGREM
jgi:hypothetical protein